MEISIEKIVDDISNSTNRTLIEISSELNNLAIKAVGKAYPDHEIDIWHPLGEHSSYHKTNFQNLGEKLKDKKVVIVLDEVFKFTSNKDGHVVSDLVIKYRDNHNLRIIGLTNPQEFFHNDLKKSDYNLNIDRIRLIREPIRAFNSIISYTQPRENFTSNFNRKVYI